MRLIIRTNGVIWTAQWPEAQQRLLFAIGRFASRVRSLTVRLSDVNGSRTAGRDRAGRAPDGPGGRARRADGLTLATSATAVCGVNDVELAQDHSVPGLLDGGWRSRPRRHSHRRGRSRSRRRPCARRDSYVTNRTR